MSEAKISCLKRTVEKTEADRMFEKLGYKMEIYKKPIEGYEATNAIMDTVVAYCIDDINEEQRYRFEFFLEHQKVIKNTRFWSFNEDVLSDAITMEELQAINKKVEELRMDIEEAKKIVKNIPKIHIIAGNKTRLAIKKVLKELEYQTNLARINDALKHQYQYEWLEQRRIIREYERKTDNDK